MASTQETLLALLKDMLEKVPSLFMKVAEFIEDFYHRTQGNSGVSQPPAVPSGPIDVTQDDGTGSYHIDPVGITFEQRKAIREGIADGIVKEKALEWVKGLITGIALAS